jgi:AcrR family transcriptional regulator
MRVEDVAARSGVHKTTIYRRWPTKEDLVAATLTTMMKASEKFAAVDTGAVRRDLRASLVSLLELNPTEQGILRIMQVERAIPAVNAMANQFRDALRAMRLTMVRRGVTRGELPAGVDPELIVDLVSAPAQMALLFNEPMDARYLDRVLDVVLAGAVACACAKPRKVQRRALPRASKTRTAR